MRKIYVGKPFVAPLGYALPQGEIAEVLEAFDGEILRAVVEGFVAVPASAWGYDEFEVEIPTYKGREVTLQELQDIANQVDGSLEGRIVMSLLRSLYHALESESLYGSDRAPRR